MAVFFKVMFFEVETLILHGFAAIAIQMSPMKILKALYRNVFSYFLLFSLDIISPETIL
ncbi:MAG: hypothetical protein HC903_13690 [Methylacidiphilales bacterium]|nr:hypothetical protein [Candidatus Methylacidiphilales bacterium]NJR18610.1 hypothetical protein [Calothrix sp. CSU_2_0]